MHRGVEVGLYLRQGISDDNFVAEALGNLACFRLANQRQERLLWQVLRVQSSGAKHHYRIVVRHPDRALDLGFKSELGRILDTLSSLSEDELRAQLHQAVGEGLHVIKLRQVRLEVDFWQDDFWNWIGGPGGIGPPGSFP
jgi:hypothetical protein